MSHKFTKCLRRLAQFGVCVCVSASMCGFSKQCSYKYMTTKRRKMIKLYCNRKNRILILRSCSSEHLAPSIPLSQSTDIIKISSKSPYEIKKDHFSKTLWKQFLIQTAVHQSSSLREHCAYCLRETWCYIQDKDIIQYISEEKGRGHERRAPEKQPPQTSVTGQFLAIKKRENK